MPKLNVNNLCKSFNKNEILRDISFSANKGDVIALMGSSGSGKSTLLRCINLLTRPDAGSIRIDDQILRFDLNAPVLTSLETAHLRRKVGMVFQQFNLWAHMTVLENLIEAPIHVLKKNRIETIKAARLLLAKVGLEDKLEDYPVQLSGGQPPPACPL